MKWIAVFTLALGYCLCKKDSNESYRSHGRLSQVAFSAALYESKSGNTGPFSAATPLRYKKVFSNAGNGYNPSTDSGANSVVSLMKNGKRLTSVWDTSGTDSNDMGSNAVVIPLQVGDNVYVELQQNRVVYDDNMNYNTFSGFFLFAL
ncbi:carbonic anhydrase 2 [Sarotherodon galilaeus]